MSAATYQLLAVTIHTERGSLRSMVQSRTGPVLTWTFSLLLPAVNGMSQDPIAAWRKVHSSCAGYKTIGRLGSMHGGWEHTRLDFVRRNDFPLRYDLLCSAFHIL